MHLSWGGGGGHCRSEGGSGPSQNRTPAPALQGEPSLGWHIPVRMPVWVNSVRAPCLTTRRPCRPEPCRMVSLDPITCILSRLVGLPPLRGGPCTAGASRGTLIPADIQLHTFPVLVVGICLGLRELTVQQLEDWWSGFRGVHRTVFLQIPPQVTHSEWACSANGGPH